MLLVLSSAACAYGQLETDETAGEAEIDEDDQALIAVEPTVTTDAPRESLADLVLQTTGPEQWSFAVLSDLHLPNPRSVTVDRTVSALIAMGVRVVVITGDDTNGSAGVDHRQSRVKAWWGAVTAALEPLHAAGIAVLPLAGNHDTYLAWQREGYEQAFADLDRWAAPLQVHPAAGRGFARPPYSYSVDVGGVHFALANIVDQSVDRDVATWLSDDLAAAADARMSLVFGHVPLFSVVQRPAKGFVSQLGAILERGNADFYIAGHEHLSWDETFALRTGHLLHQVTVGCASGFYVFPPSKEARSRAGCESLDRSGKLTCTMPNGGRFELVRDPSQRMIEHDAATFTVFQVTGDDVLAIPMTVGDDGRPHAFYLTQP
jgi:hypothetical protein